MPLNNCAFSSLRKIQNFSGIQPLHLCITAAELYQVYLQPKFCLLGQGFLFTFTIIIDYFCYYLNISIIIISYMVVITFSVDICIIVTYSESRFPSLIYLITSFPFPYWHFEPTCKQKSNEVIVFAGWSHHRKPL